MFSKSFRPKSRVRPVDAPDLAVIDPPMDVSWLVDSHNALCLVPRCGAKIPRGDATMMANAMRIHRTVCDGS